jgi:hypothetical protein
MQHSGGKEVMIKVSYLVTILGLIVPAPAGIAIGEDQPPSIEFCSVDAQIEFGTAAHFHGRGRESRMLPMI